VSSVARRRRRRGRFWASIWHSGAEKKDQIYLISGDRWNLWLKSGLDCSVFHKCLLSTADIRDFA
jgi:hypothetical protein